MAINSEVRKRKRLTERVVAGLLANIVSGRYQPGQMLPSEGELGDEFDVSRTVIREAVKIVEHKGLVVVVQGRGSTVQSADAWNSLDPQIVAFQLEHDGSGRVYEELMLVRIALESEMAAEAAMHLTEELENGLRSAIDGSDAHRTEPDVLVEHDVSFHRLITEASGNRIGRGIMASLDGPLRASFRLAVRVPAEGLSAHAYHEPIFEAIVDRDPNSARRKMRVHLTSTWQSLKESGLLQPGEDPIPSSPPSSTNSR
jgi:GntR family galactonate operon transcriptional repressor